MKKLWIVLLSLFLLTYPPRASHRDLSPDELAAIGITMGQIRLSSGLEDTDDLLNDFDQALAKM